MIRKLDQVWLWLLCAVNGWVVRCARAHCRREKRRWFWRHLGQQRRELN